MEETKDIYSSIFLAYNFKVLELHLSIFLS